MRSVLNPPAQNCWVVGESQSTNSVSVHSYNLGEQITFLYLSQYTYIQLFQLLKHTCAHATIYQFITHTALGAQRAPAA